MDWMGRLSDLSRLKPDWDSYKGREIYKECLGRCWDLMLELWEYEEYRRDIFPCPDGTLGVEYALPTLPITEVEIYVEEDRYPVLIDRTEFNSESYEDLRMRFTEVDVATIGGLKEMLREIIESM